MKISMILCTRNRGEQLRTCLQKMAGVEPTRRDIEFVIVDNGSTDDTQAVIEAFKPHAPFSVKSVMAAEPGLARARNAGLAASTGDWLFFTDDDCYLEPGFFSKFERAVGQSGCDYGGGQILLFSADDDERVANLKVARLKRFPARTGVIAAGQIQGANMFFRRQVFDTAGPFNANLGAGTRFPCEDIEMAARASRFGFTGAQVPGFTVYHHHGRKRNSPEAEKTVLEYDTGRGAYYGTLLAAGVPKVWPIWWKQTTRHGETDGLTQLKQLSRELQGAAAYLEFATGIGAVDGKSLNDANIAVMAIKRLVRGQSS